MKCAVEVVVVIQILRFQTVFALHSVRYSDQTSWVWSPVRQSRSLRDFVTFSRFSYLKQTKTADFIVLDSIGNCQESKLQVLNTFLKSRFSISCPSSR